ncbi:hypothetical protein ANANG_G00291500 [Anguilla anguilla]|uniref:Argonaute hook domain-containing protein n=1 Tax=Anguilla anguilla TaxID=7936 RepID=A0A9D3RJK2_ANGAN|nr:hypothetical protein ANANG_G00291500 [Anguilla anguilla]
MGGKPHQGWGGKAHPSQIPNSQGGPPKGPVQPPAQQSQPLDPGALQGGWGRSGGPPSQKQNQSWGWTSGPVPQTAGGSGEGPEPSGWEEPSPHSISRKMEIDDGTSAWGDPNVYNGKSVNLWDKNGGTALQPQGPAHQPQGPAHQPQGPAHQPHGPAHHPHGTTHQPQGHAQQQPPASRAAHPPAAAGNPAQSGKAPALWGGSIAPSGQGTDSGTAAWGKVDSSTGWGDLEDSGKTSGWGNPSPNPVKSGSKSMQEGWGEGAEAGGSVSASRHSSWEEEEDGGGVWNSAGSQGSGSSYNSGSWGPSGKKSSSKGALKGGGGDSWMNPVTRQFSNMGLLGEEPGSRPLDLAPGLTQDKKQEGEKRGMSLNDYNGEMRKGGRGGGAVFRPHGSKDTGPGEPGSYYDKTGGHSAFGGGAGMAQSRGVPSINPSPGIRAQVPHQFLSPQVPGSVLKQMAPPSSNVGGVAGVGGGVFPPQLSPQHIAMLSNIYPHVQQFHLACQLLLQQQQQQHLLQNQRKFPQNLRQPPDPQQLARVMAILQQQQRQQQGVGSKLSPSHLGGGAPKQPMADPLPHPGMGGSLADLHPKTQGGYSGFPSGVNLSGLELGGMKDSGGQQSRFKWMMEGRSPAPSPPDSSPTQERSHLYPCENGGWLPLLPV